MRHPIVVDASVAGTVAFPDEIDHGRDTWLRALWGGLIVVPALFWFEVRNMLVIQERRQRFTPEETVEFLADLEIMDILVDTEPESGAVLDLARRHRLTVYDAAYLEVSRRRGHSLATLDRALVKAAAAEGVEVVGLN